MTEKEKEIMRAIAAALPLMSPFEKGYFLGVAESKASEAGQLHIKKEQEEPDRILA
ncbi:hypothetical protein C805_00014 [Eubacterium sp. 14-2]|uniref:hypothetical protein n=1 Tax=Eubacterium sp. 14-2 TaxID=1235790 RepID=UPI000335C3E3|nr:hypothetical protein [Eubacterium sp. 14-2]EOT29431.1 hypothetical protein C805_00014 [Eubacterium sp. 14-2]